MRVCQNLNISKRSEAGKIDYVYGIGNVCVALASRAFVGMLKTATGILSAVPLVGGNQVVSECLDRVNAFAERIRCAFELHAVQNLAITSLPKNYSNIEVRSRNMLARSEVFSYIVDEKIDKLREKFISPSYCQSKGLNPLDPLLRYNMQISKIRNLVEARGICSAASLIVIKDLLKRPVYSKQEMIQTLKKFEYGFPSKTAALQSLQRMYCDCLRVLRFKNLSEYEGKDRNLRIVERTASLINLKATGHFENVDLDRECFDRLPLGHYYLRFQLKSNGHAVVYIKQKFGSFLYDSNYGLKDCSTQAPSQSVQVMLDHYIKGLWRALPFGKIRVEWMRFELFK